jgi:hypothetical protein
MTVVIDHEHGLREGVTVPSSALEGSVQLTIVPERRFGAAATDVTFYREKEDFAYKV